MSVGVILPAGGSGTRAGPGAPKQFRTLGKKYLYEHALETFHSLPEIETIVLVVPKQERNNLSNRLRALKKVRVCEGGAARWVSVQKGFRQLPSHLLTILVHDAARPFVSPQLIRNCISSAETQGVTITALPVVDTIKQTKDDRVEKTLNRSCLVAVQTPQAFPYAVLERVYGMDSSHWEQNAPTDEAGMVETMGESVFCIQGEVNNRKITTPEDFHWAEWVLSQAAKETYQ